APAALLEPGVPGRADVGPLGDLLAAQARRAPALRWESECRRVQLAAAVLQIGSKPPVVARAPAHTVSPYTPIRSLLYQDTLRARHLSPIISWRFGDACVCHRGDRIHRLGRRC